MESEIRQDHQPFIPQRAWDATSPNAVRFRIPLASRIDSTLLRLRHELSILVNGGNGQESGEARDGQGHIAKWEPILRYLKDNRLIADAAFADCFNDAIKVFIFRITSPFNQGASDGYPPEYDTYGRGTSYFAPDEAISKAVGEFLERLTLAIYRDKDFLRASTRDLRNRNYAFLDPTEIAGFSNEQKTRDPSRNFTEKSLFYWARGVNLSARSPALIPAQLIFWNYCRHHDGYIEPFLRETNTNGAAGYFSETGAILAGIYENIQRDAFLLHWFNSRPPPIIENASIPDTHIQSLLEKANRYHLKVIFLDTTLDTTVPSCVCLILDGDENKYRICLGGGCDFSASKTLTQSLTEAISMYQWLRSNPETANLPENYTPFADANMNQNRRLKLWGNPQMFSKFHFFLQGPIEKFSVFAEHQKIFRSERAELMRVLDSLRTLGPGYEIYQYNTHHKALRDLGYFSVKIIIPKLISLYLYELNAPLGSDRIADVRKKFGWGELNSINPLPHPFP